MSQLILNLEGGQVRSFRLRPGVNYIGSKPGTQVQISHESVSGVHAAIEIEGDRAILRDRESANGTQVNDQLILEMELTPGDCVTVGDVKLTFEAGEPDDVAESAGATTPRPAQSGLGQPEARFVGETYCRNHRDSLVHYHCSHCDKYFCDLCVSPRPEAGIVKHFCRACGNLCSPVRSGFEVKEPERFGALLGGAFAYPFKGNGPVLLLSGTAFLILIDVILTVARFALAIGFIAMLITTVFGAGYLFSYIKSVVLTSATGSDSMPDWPDFTDWLDAVVVPFFQMVALQVICLGPAFIALMFAERIDGPARWVAPTALALVGIVYLPMALLGISMFDGLIGVNPALLVPSMFKVAGQYTLALLVLVGAGACAWGSEALIRKVLPGPILPSMAGRAISFYSLIVEARVLGVLYRANAGRLGWF